jgi:hypothetical protein
MTLPSRLAVSLLAVTVVCACATDAPAPAPHHRHHGEGGGDGPAPAVAGRGGGLFISPMGQPYRAGPGEPYPSVAWFTAVNTAHDGKLTRKEFRADAAAFFQRIDANHDGVIDAQEITAYEHAVPEIVEGFRPAQGGGGLAASGQGGGRHGGRHGGGMGGGGGAGYGRGGSHSSSQPAARADDTHPEGAAWFSFLSIPEPVASADRNLDGRITLQEFLEAADGRFDLLDADQKGYLTLDALPKTPVQTLRR